MNWTRIPCPLHLDFTEASNVLDLARYMWTSKVREHGSCLMKVLLEHIYLYSNSSSIILMQSCLLSTLHIDNRTFFLVFLCTLFLKPLITIAHVPTSVLTLEGKIMGDVIEVVEDKVVEISPRMSEVVPVERECKNFECLTERKRSLQARYVYGFIFLLTNLMAWAIRDYGYKVFPQLHYLKVCDVGGRDCSRTNGVLRVSLGCCIFFVIMFLTTMNTRQLYEARNRWHCGWWSLKLVLLIISLAIPFFCPSAFIQYYGEVARIGAGIFLLLQLVSVIQFITWWNNYWMPDSEVKRTSVLGLLISTIFYIASVCGIILMYFPYARRPSCSLNLFFITWTAILFIVMMIISLNSKVNRGLLSSGIMASYIIFLCWSAIRSEPSSEKCSPASELAGKHDWTTVLGFLIAICAIVMATFSTGVDSQSFQFQKDEVQWEDDIPYKYGFFHAVFSLGAMYFAMLFVSWQLDHSVQKWSIDVGWTSTWVKIVNEWFAASIYLWKLISPVVRQAKVMDQEEAMRHASNLA